MSELSRRGFLLSGTLVGMAAAAGEALVKLADPADVQALTVGQPTVLSAARSVMPALGMGEIVYRQTDGRFLPVGVIRRGTWHREMIDVTQWSDPVNKFIPGTHSTLLLELECFRPGVDL